MFKLISLALLLYAAQVHAQSVTGAFVTLADGGKFYFKMISADGNGRGICYHVGSSDQDEVVWRTEGWYAVSLALSADGRYLVRGGADAIYVYGDGKLMARYGADQLGLEKITFDLQRSRFQPESGQFLLVTRDGAGRLLTIGESPGQKPTAPVAVEIVDRGRSVDAGRGRPRTGDAVPAPVAEPVPSVSFKCEVVASYFGSSKTRSIVQPGPSADIATERAMAYCEGIVGIGSKHPSGACQPGRCIEVGAAAGP